MGWGNCGTDSKGRPIGYYHAAKCDEPGCAAEIDRGLSYACGGMHGTGSLGGDERVDWDSFNVACEGYFCEAHRRPPSLEHEDGADLWAPHLCGSCATKLEEAYRTDPDWRAQWPTDEAPLATGDPA